ncbi:hypothetical protein K435DRAFT_754126 [Dendrothele bispora CBS 962.96]|uniref:FAD-binding FR-type domain-containing protein n=1 Tax=Dendrothele bispora (strain CBS 962.96) TaxID=1314807 RepID=A0A4V4HG40_DENBC|nr:hypothetical protein K435DRAFT_754126 [Dendrothele bispora CBS 962.96]
MSSSFSGASNATQTTPAISPSVTVISTASATPPLRAVTIVYYTDLILISLFLFVVLLRLPRALARFWNVSEWTNGLILRYTRIRRSGRAGAGHLSTDDTHVNYGSYQWHLDLGTKENPIPPSYPPHVTSCPPVLRPVLNFLHLRASPGVSIFHVSIMTVYLAVLAFPTFYNTNVFTDPYRYGYIAVSQFPIVFGFGVKNGVVGWLIGAGYEKVNFMHRFTGRVLFLAVNVHTLGYIYRWTNQGTFTQNIARPTAYWGLIATICIDLIFFFSIDFWRGRAYNVFLVTHILGVILLFPSTYLHTPISLPFLAASLLPYLLDLVILRTLKTRTTTATLLPLPSLQITRITLPYINTGWRGGQHVRLRVLTTDNRLGKLGWVETHPLTIASASGTEEGMVLLCKKSGDWTTGLFELAKQGGSLGDEKGKRGEGEGVRVRVMVEGPYGGPGHRMFSSFSAAVFVVGGSGISFALSAIQEMIQKDLEGQCRAKWIQLVWSVQDPASLVPLLPLLISMIQQSIYTPLHIAVFYTRVTVGQFPFKPDFFRSTRLTLSSGRPKISKIVEDAISRAAALRRSPSSRSRSRSGRDAGRHGSQRRRNRVEDEEAAKDRGRLKGVVVGVCGPVGMADGVFEEVGKVDKRRREQVGGVEVHEETFGW